MRQLSLFSLLPRSCSYAASRSVIATVGAGSIGLLSGLFSHLGLAAIAQPIASQEIAIPASAPSIPALEVDAASVPAPPASVLEAPAAIAAPEAAPPEGFSPTAVAPIPPTMADPAVKAIAPSRGAASASSGDEAPSELVLSERSSGCQSSFRGAVGNPCGEAQARLAADGLAAQGLSQTGTGLNPALAQALGTAVYQGSLGSSGAVAYSGTYSGAIAPGGQLSAQPFYRRTPRPQGRIGNSLKLMFPLSIPAAISSVFGWRIHPISGDARFHSGTDLAAPLGTPVLAAQAGQVAIADFLGGYGLAVALDHGATNKTPALQQTLYGHLSEIFVRPGDQVKQGDVIGRVGSTGNSTGPHLHFELRESTAEGWVAVDAGEPLELALAELWQALQVAQKPTAQIAIQPQAPTQSQPIPRSKQPATVVR